MKKIIKFIFSRLFIVTFSLVLQFFFLVFLVLRISEYGVYIYAALEIFSLIVVLWIVSKRDNPSYKIAWIIAVMTFPIFGGIVYLVFGKKAVGKRRPAPVNKYFPGENCGVKFDEANWPSQHLLRQGAYAKNAGGFPVWKNTKAEFYPLGEDFWHALLRELDKAEKFIFMEYFIIQEGKMWDPVLDILAKKAAAGVEVRLLYDDLGTIKTLPNHYQKKMEQLGIQCRVFNSFKPILNSMFNYRDHRKITVIDGDTGFCGGINLADEYINAYEKHGHWKDTAVMLKGDATQSLTAMFLQLWDYQGKTESDLNPYLPSGRVYGDDGLVQPYGDMPIDDTNLAENIYLQMINNAKKYVYIATPYLVLDNEMTTALVLAAQSGVDVRIITPHIADKWYVHAMTRSSYPQLIEGGVRIYEYTPGFIHAKMVVADDEVAVVGSANMDYRSFYLHYECGVTFFYSSVIKSVKQDILNTIEISQQIQPDSIKKEPFYLRFGRMILKIFAPMM